MRKTGARKRTRPAAKPEPFYSVQISSERDVALMRRMAYRMALLLGFSGRDPVRIMVAVSEIAHRITQYAGGGTVEFMVKKVKRSPMFIIHMSDKGAESSRTAAKREEKRTFESIGSGIIGARSLMDYFEIQNVPGRDTSVWLGKTLPKKIESATGWSAADITKKLARPVSQDVWQQDLEILNILDELRKREEEAVMLKQELESTNDGVIALYAELDNKAEQLRRANEMKTRFLSSVSHEIRTPINTVLSLSRILLDRLDGELTQEQQKQVNFIRKAAEDLSELVNGLLDIARIEAGKVEVKPSEFEVGKLFNTLSGMMSPLNVNAAVALIFERPTGIPPLNTDEGKVSQILRNLITNALKFTERGEVRVSVKMNDEGSAAIFSVADTGIGIAPEHQEIIFDEFTQLDTHLHRKFKGTGLGLPLSKKLAELLGGSISVTSSPGAGSTFTVVIPITYSGRKSEEAAPTQVAPLQPPRAETKVLIIDDEEVARYTFKKFLASAPYAVIEAESGQEGLRRVREDRPHVIFLDMAMPEMNGFETLERLKADPATRDIPVIIYTATELSKEDRRSLARNSVTVLSKKDATGEAIVAHIKKALARE